MKKIYKYGTGQEAPEGAVYLNTVTQTWEWNGYYNEGTGRWERCWYVWHYFLVEVKE